MNQDNDPLANVVRLSDRRGKQCETDIINALDDYMLQAKTGKLRAIAIAAVDVDRKSSTSIVRMQRPGEHDYSVVLLGAVEWLKGRIFKRVDED